MFASLAVPKPLLRTTGRWVAVARYSQSAQEKFVYDKLAARLSPSQLDVADISGGCGSMYAINITSAKFKGLSIVKQHKLVNEILKDEISGWHGLQLRTKAQ